MLGRSEIAARVPHSGRMCLLERVTAWDAKRIDCAAGNHRAVDHPLREPGGLPVWAGIEYAAQATAVHGSLLRKDSPVRHALLAKLSHVQPHCDWLDRVGSELTFGAEVLHDDPLGAVYAFEVHGDGALLLQGRLTIVFTSAWPAATR